MIDYYVFEDEATAIASEAMICQIGQTPIVGINAATGQPEPTKAKTERWAIPQQRLDGKWVFPVVPEKMRQNIPVEQQQAWSVAFPHKIETSTDEWWPTPPEI